MPNRKASRPRKVKGTRFCEHGPEMDRWMPPEGPPLRTAEAGAPPVAGYTIEAFCLHNRLGRAQFEKLFDTGKIRAVWNSQEVVIPPGELEAWIYRLDHPSLFPEELDLGPMVDPLVEAPRAAAPVWLLPGSPSAEGGLSGRVSGSFAECADSLSSVSCRLVHGGEGRGSFMKLERGLNERLTSMASTDTDRPPKGA
jgi:hypothetical protein